MKKKDLHRNPLVQFQRWFEDAVATGMANPEAMTLVTATSRGLPSARIVLYKGMSQDRLCFFTNYDSRKAHQLHKNPHASLVFYWPNLERQIRVEGEVVRLSSQESDEYWLTRPRESRLGALASHQSEVIRNRQVLENRVQLLTKKYEGKEIPRPKNWGGFGLRPHYFEFWVAGAYRLHDRFRFLKTARGWKLEQLSP